MRVARHPAHAGAAVRPRIVAAGGFDGVHLGHRRVLEATVELARGSCGDAVAVVARDAGEAPRLVDRRQQLEHLREIGIDMVVFASATDVEAVAAGLGASIRVDVAGSDRRRAAGRSLVWVEPVEVDAMRISAGAVKAALARGDLASARAMLGRDPGVAGRVVHGFCRGAALGIPTANLRVRGIQLPPDGVYVVRVRVAGTTLRGVTNVGFNPTFGNRTRTVETHLLDFGGDLYGRRLEVDFLAHLRGERKFAEVAQLLMQIRDDTVAARRFFASDGG